MPQCLIEINAPLLPHAFQPAYPNLVGGVSAILVWSLMSNELGIGAAKPQSKTWVYLIADGYPVLKAGAVTRCLAVPAAAIRIFWLPHTAWRSTRMNF